MDSKGQAGTLARSSSRASIDESAREQQVRRRGIRADDGLRAHEHHLMRHVQEMIAAAIARDLGVSPDDLEPRMAAAAMLTVFELLGEDYAEAPPAEALAVIDRARLFIGGGISALR
jgi:hypothetical protein